MKWKVLWKEIFQFIFTRGEKTVPLTKYLVSCTIILRDDALLHYRKAVSFQIFSIMVDGSIRMLKRQLLKLQVHQSTHANHKKSEWESKSLQFSNTAPWVRLPQYSFRTNLFRIT